MNFLSIIAAVVLSVMVNAALVHAPVFGTATTFQTQTSDTIETFRQNVNNSLTNLSLNSVSTSSPYTWAALQQFLNASTSISSCYGPCYFGGTATSTFTLGGFLGFASTSPWGVFSINADALANTAVQFAVGSSTGGTAFVIDRGSRVGVGTTSPGTLFSVQNSANFTTATSTFISTLQSPNFAISAQGTGCAQIGAGGYIKTTGVACGAGLIFSSSNINQISSTAASTTVYTVVIPANTFDGITKVLRVTTLWNQQSTGAPSCSYGMDFGSGSATTTLVGYTSNTNGGLKPNSFVAYMDATSTISQMWLSQGTVGLSDALPYTVASAPWIGGRYSAIDLTAKSYLGFVINSPGGSINCKLDGITVELLSQ